MLIQEQAVEIRVLARQVHSIREANKALGVSRNTVRRYLKEPSVPRYSREPRPMLAIMLRWSSLSKIMPIR